MMGKLPSPLVTKNLDKYKNNSSDIAQNAALILGIRKRSEMTIMRILSFCLEPHSRSWCRCTAPKHSTVISLNSGDKFGKTETTTCYAEQSDGGEGNCTERKCFRNFKQYCHQVFGSTLSCACLRLRSSRLSKELWNKGRNRVGLGGEKGSKEEEKW